jgi:hypothetical protein
MQRFASRCALLLIGALLVSGVDFSPDPATQLAREASLGRAGAAAAVASRVRGHERAIRTREREDRNILVASELEPWHEVGAAGEPSFSSLAGVAWSNVYTDGYATTAAFFVDAANVVHLKGYVKKANRNSPSTIFVLPVGYRPSTLWQIPSASPIDAGGNDATYIAIQPDGQVEILGMDGTKPGAGYAMLDGVTFRL